LILAVTMTLNMPAARWPPQGDVAAFAQAA
jgi:hypothetical protein